ncbi:MAG TPA: FAD-dependent monooxygenase [Xanthobacteraceae bacterium]|nr:FAD-dependent monooxygenase [Xanthobacteraceae bacterium]
MPAPSPIIIAGAGIGGLTAALAVARAGYRVMVLEQAERIEEIGAGIQMTPNATAVLTDLGQHDRLRPVSIAPDEICIRDARSGEALSHVPLGEHVARRYGAPYWIAHRHDLVSVLRDAAMANAAITVVNGWRLDNFSADAAGVTVRDAGGRTETGIALIGADGLWSAVRGVLGHAERPRFRHRLAWRALVPLDAVPPALRDRHIHLWLGPQAHLVHYPVKAGAFINIVAVTQSAHGESGWSRDGTTADLLAQFPARAWAASARDLLAAASDWQTTGWQTWALYDRPPQERWGSGAVTLLGDAVHPMVPFLAQGAGMAIEDAAVLGVCLQQNSDLPAALRRYENLRRARTGRVQNAAARNGTFYHVGGIPAAIRNTIMRLRGGDGMLAHYDWLYGWRCDGPASP